MPHTLDVLTRRFCRLALTLSLAGVLSACGGGGSSGTAGAPGVPGSAGLPGVAGTPALIATAPEPAGANCPMGGIRVQAGADSNGDGVLQAAEVTNTSFVCAGATGLVGPVGPAGTPGATSPTGATGATGTTGLPGTPGTPGATGGTGATGATGSAGTPGAVSLLVLTLEPAGANCPSGGTRVQAGLDANGNGMLDAAEITAAGTRYVCNAPASPGSILAAVNGMGAGKTMSFVVNGGSPVTVSTNGFTSLASGLVAGSAYTVTVGTQPAGQTCNLTGATGTVLAGAVATPVANCIDNLVDLYLQVDGLGAGKTMRILANGEITTFSTNGSFLLARPLVAGSTYTIFVVLQPAQQFCIVLGATGTVPTMQPLFVVPVRCI